MVEETSLLIGSPRLYFCNKWTLRLYRYLPYKTRLTHRSFYTRNNNDLFASLKEARESGSLIVHV